MTREKLNWPAKNCLCLRQDTQFVKSAGGQAGRFTKAAAAFNGLNGANPIGTSLEPQEEDYSSCDSMVHLIALDSLLGTGTNR